MPRGRGARRYRDRAFTLERAEYHTHTHTHTRTHSHTHTTPGWKMKGIGNFNFIIPFHR